MVWGVSGPAWGCWFTSIKVCTSCTKVLRKSKKKTAQKLFSSSYSVMRGPQAKYSNFLAVFSEFLKSSWVMSKPLYRWKNTQASPETPYHVWKVWILFFKMNFLLFFDLFPCPPPHGLITVKRCSTNRVKKIVINQFPKNSSSRTFLNHNFWKYQAFQAWNNFQTSLSMHDWQYLRDKF